MSPIRLLYNNLNHPTRLATNQSVLHSQRARPSIFFPFFQSPTMTEMLKITKKLNECNDSIQSILCRPNHSTIATCKETTPTTPVVKRRASLSSQHTHNLGFGASENCLCKTPSSTYYPCVSRVRSCWSRDFLGSTDPCSKSAMTIRSSSHGHGRNDYRLLSYWNVLDEFNLLLHDMSEMAPNYFLILCQKWL